MARILIGWELGANRGHAVRMAKLGRALREQGHDIAFALQRIDALGSEEAGGATIWQAPVTPRLLVNTARGGGSSPAGLADILARLGIDDPVIVTAMVRAWRQLFAAVRPELVIAEYAPFLLLAARARLPSVAVGTGFATPPPELATFPRIVPEAAGATDQTATLRAVNAAIADLGDEPLAALPRLFGADMAVTATFTELDPYAGDRRNVLAHPARGIDEAPSGGEEVFVYAPEALNGQAPLWSGLAEAGLATRVHMPHASPAMRAALAARGFAFEPEPLPIADIVERSRLLVSHGGHGFVCAGLAAGLPHVVCYPDIEKQFYGRALARLGCGGHVGLASIEPKAFGASLKRIYQDDAMSARARDAAPAFRERGGPSVEAAVVEAVAALA